jgi:DNA-binding winged helix-turn-helix (wHTH) protein/Tol biopolymer transport system component
MSGSDRAQIAEFGPFRFDRALGFLYCDGEEVPLPPRAAGVLDHLLEHPGTLVSKDDLLDSVWDSAEVTEYSLVEAIKVVRKALGDEGRERRYVQTIHGRGYRFVAEVRWQAVPEANAVAENGEATPQVGRGQGAPRVGGWALLGGGIAIGILLGLLVGRGGWQSPLPQGETPLHMSLVLPEDAALVPQGSQPVLAVSADGRQIAYVGRADGETRLFLVRLDQPGAVAVPNTERALLPRFSPDGEWLAFVAGGGNRPLELRKARLPDGESISLGTVGRQPGGLHWGPDGFIYFNPDPGMGIHRIPEEGGDVTVVTSPALAGGGEAQGVVETHLWPQVLDGGQALLFTSLTRGVGAAIDVGVMVQSLVDESQRTLVDGASRGQWLGNDVLTFIRDGSLWAARVGDDGASVVLPGERILAEVEAPLLAVSSGNGLVAYVDHDSPPWSLAWLRRDGESEAFPGTTSYCQYPTLSPGGATVALTCRFGGQSEIALFDTTRGTGTRVTFEGGNSVGIWTSDGSDIVFSTNREGSWTLSRMPAGADVAAEVITTSDYPVYPQDVSPDNRTLLFQRIHPEFGEGIWKADLAGEEDPEPLVDGPFHESGARFSPNGRWVAYHSNEADGWHVYVRALTAPARKIRVSTSGGGWPVWTDDGRELLYLTNRGEAIMAVTVETGDPLNVGLPRQVLAAPLAPRNRRGAVFDLSPDGTRVLMPAAPDPGPITQLMVKTGWLRSLEPGA